MGANVTTDSLDDCIEDLQTSGDIVTEIMTHHITFNATCIYTLCEIDEVTTTTTTEPEVPAPTTTPIPVVANNRVIVLVAVLVPLGVIILVAISIGGYIALQNMDKSTGKSRRGYKRF